MDAHLGGNDIPPGDSISRQGQLYNAANMLNSSPQTRQGLIKPKIDKLAPSVAFANLQCGNYLMPAPPEHVNTSARSIGLEGTRGLLSPPTQVSRKRRRVETGYSINNGDEDNDSNYDDDVTSKLPARTGDECTRGYACPFFRRDPVRYIDCLTRKLTRIRDVKQHIERRHTRPRYCPICYKIFSSAPDCDVHIRSQRCVSRGPTIIDNFEGVSREMLRLLKSKVSRTAPREQWYSVWDTVFPGVTRPDSPYLDSTIEEIIGIVRNLWEREAIQILSNFPKKTQIQCRDNADATQLISELLHNLQNHARKTIHENCPAESPGSALSSHRDTTHTSRKLSSPSSRETLVPFYWAGDDLLVPNQQGRQDLLDNNSCFQASWLVGAQGNYFGTEDCMPGFNYFPSSDLPSCHFPSIQDQATFAGSNPLSFQLDSRPYQTSLISQSDMEEYVDFLARL